MPISVQCSCGAKLKAKDELAGKRVKCPKCKQPLLIAPPPSAEEDTYALADDGATSAPPAPAEEDTYALADDGAASRPVKLPSPVLRRAPSAAEDAEKRPPAKANQTALIAVIVGGGALVMVLAVGLIAWMLSSGGEEVAQETPTANDQASAPQGPASPTKHPAGDEPELEEPELDEPGAAAGVETAVDPGRPPATPEATAAPESPEVEIRDDNGLGMRLCRCPPGKFPYGPKGSYAEITHEFWLGQTEVTQGHWKQLMQTTPWTESEDAVSDDNHPASMISWNDANAFCERLTQLEREQGRIGADLEYRLPTEAEWNYANRAPKISRLTGRPIKADHFAWYKHNSGKRIHRVAELQPDSWGLYDIRGNVAEWALDRFADYEQVKLPLYGGQDPFQWYDVEEGAESLHLSHGGNYRGASSNAWNRGRGVPASGTYPACGFRVALARPAKPTQAPERPVEKEKVVAAPEPSSDGVWVVLSGLRSEPAANGKKILIDWELVQGRVQPGKKYQVFVFSQGLEETSRHYVHRSEVDLSQKQGTVGIVVPPPPIPEPTVFAKAVVGEEKGLGYELLVSGELTRSRRSSPKKPPER